MVSENGSFSGGGGGFAPDFLKKMTMAKIANGPGASQNQAYGGAPIQELLKAYGETGGSNMARMGGFDIVPYMNGTFAVNPAGVPGLGASQHNDRPYDIYDAQGNYLGSNTWQDIGTDGVDKVVDGTTKALTAAFIGGGMLGGLGIGPMASGGAGAGTGAGAGAGMSGAAFGDAGLMYAGADAAAAGTLGGGASLGGGAGLAGTAALGAGGMGGGGAGGTMGLGGASGGGGGSSMLGGGSSMLGGGSSLLGGGSNLLGLGATALGALGGGQGQNASTSSTRAMDPRMDNLFFGDLALRTQQTLANQLPTAWGAGSQMLQKGSGLLGQTAPTTASNPYLRSIADDMQRRTTDLLGQNNLAIQGNAVGTGGLGGSRQGVAQGMAASRAADSLQGQVAGLYGGAYENDQNRLRQDWTIGSGMMNQGLNMPFQPLQDTAQIYSPFTGTGTTTNSQQSGGGWQGAAGGALSGASLGRQMGWW